MSQNADDFSSIFIFLAMFGGSTFLLFLMCYCCQKKMREDSFSPLESGQGLDSPHQQAPSVPDMRYPNMIPQSPPPAYDSVVKKDPITLDPPPYDEAVANLQAGGYV